MKKELTERLFKECPRLFRGKDFGVQQNLMCFGFECRDGWFNLIYDLSKKIEAIIERDNLDNVYALQVKEKYGGLVFNVAFTDEIGNLIEEAEEKSFHICEECGEPGDLHIRGNWLKTICRTCIENDPSLEGYEPESSFIPDV